jgi:hypothetical protein
MESGKSMNILADQIASFDTEKFMSSKKESYLKEFVETTKIPGVSFISVDRECVHVYTKNLYAIDERTNKYHDIGTFYIKIGMVSSTYDTSNTVNITNTKHKISAYESAMNAPHVFSNGKICHGSLAKGMVEAYARKDLFQLIYQLILFLQTANTDDSAGKYIDRWPEVSEKVALGFDDYGYGINYNDYGDDVFSSAIQTT